MSTVKALMARLIAWLCQATDAHVRGWCPCSACDDAERAARQACRMPLRHPERITRDLPGGQEEWLAATAAALWPGDEYTTLIDPPAGEDPS